MTHRPTRPSLASDLRAVWSMRSVDPHAAVMLAVFPAAWIAAMILEIFA